MEITTHQIKLQFGISAYKINKLVKEGKLERHKRYYQVPNFWNYREAFYYDLDELKKVLATKNR